MYPFEVGRCAEWMGSHGTVSFCVYCIIVILVLPSSDRKMFY
jgi:hypothetical protein